MEHLTKEQLEEMTLSEKCSLLEETDKYGLTSSESLKQYAIDKIKNDEYSAGANVAEALSSGSNTDYWFYDYSCGSLDTPTPINSIEDIQFAIDDYLKNEGDV